MNNNTKLQKITILSLMIAMDFILSPIFRIEGMAPMSSVMNVTAAVLMGPEYTVLMALICAAMRMLLFGIPPLAFTGAFFGALLAGFFYKYSKNIWLAALGEIIGTGLLGSLASYPIMVLYTGTTSNLYWWIFTPRFFGGAISGSVIAMLLLHRLTKLASFKKIQHEYFN